MHIFELGDNTSAHHRVMFHWYLRYIFQIFRPPRQKQRRVNCVSPWVRNNQRAFKDTQGPLKLFVSLFPINQSMSLRSESAIHDPLNYFFKNSVCSEHTGPIVIHSTLKFITLNVKAVYHLKTQPEHLDTTLKTLFCSVSDSRAVWGYRPTSSGCILLKVQINLHRLCLAWASPLICH